MFQSPINGPYSEVTTGTKVDDVIDQIDEIFHVNTGSPYDNTRRASYDKTRRRSSAISAIIDIGKKKTLQKGTFHCLLFEHRNVRGKRA